MAENAGPICNKPGVPFKVILCKVVSKIVIRSKCQEDILQTQIRPLLVSLVTRDPQDRRKLFPSPSFIKTLRLSSHTSKVPSTVPSATDFSNALPQFIGFLTGTPISVPHFCYMEID